MLGDIFVFDAVIHQYDMSDDNLRTDVSTAEHGRRQMLGYTTAVMAKENKSIEYKRRWTVEDMHDLVFVQSPVDFAMAQVVPIFDWYKDWFSPVEAQYALAKAYPDRVLFCGGVDPNFRGLADALEQMERQVKEMGAVSMKFYNGHIDGSWRCDDEKVAYPLYEKCRELGIKVVQFHKGVPFGKQNMEHLRPNDLQAAARDFPELEFVIHHVALPYFDEALNIGARFPNIHLALSGNVAAYLFAPRKFLKMLGEMMQVAGVNKIIWGSEAALIGTPAPYLRAFKDLAMPEDLRRDYGYPEVTWEDKRKILGGNFAKLMGIDLAAKQRELAARPVVSRLSAAE